MASPGPPPKRYLREVIAVLRPGHRTCAPPVQRAAISVKGEVIDLWYSGNKTADLADKEAALAAHPESFCTIPHFDG